MSDGTGDGRTAVSVINKDVIIRTALPAISQTAHSPASSFITRRKPMTARAVRAGLPKKRHNDTMPNEPTDGFFCLRNAKETYGYNNNNNNNNNNCNNYNNNNNNNFNNFKNRNSYYNMIILITTMKIIL
jgi:hypothetical protein